MTTTPSTEDHIAEHIPWEHLTINPPPDRSRLLYGIAAAIAVAVVAIVAFQQFGPRPVAVQQPIREPAGLTTPAGAQPASPENAGATQLPVPAAPAIVSEADLMAVEPGEFQRTVAARAEWVVLEFFSLDPGEDWGDRVSAASSLRLPSEMRPSAPDPSTVSYVEWVRTYSLDLTGPGSFTATVILRRLVALDGVTYERLPTEWVVVDLAVDTTGAPYVSSLPRFTHLPSGEMVELIVDEHLSTDTMGIGWPSDQPVEQSP